MSDETEKLKGAIAVLVELGLAYTEWEGELVMSQEAWDHDRREFPCLTQELWDRLLELQGMRKRALKLVGEIVGPPDDQADPSK